MYLALLSGLVIPVNLIFGGIRTEVLFKVTDNFILLVGRLVVLIGFLFMVYLFNQASVQSFYYILGSCIVFSACQILESTVMDKLSKAFPPTLKRGNWGALFYLSEAGFLGRFLANVWITIAFSVKDYDHSLYVVYIPLLSIAGVLLLYSIYRLFCVKN